MRKRDLVAVGICAFGVGVAAVGIGAGAFGAACAYRLIRRAQEKRIELEREEAAKAAAREAACDEKKAASSTPPATSEEIAAESDAVAEDDEMDVEEDEDDAEEETEEFCFFTESGNVWHSSAVCPYIRGKGDIKLSTVQNALQAGKVRGCARCYESE